MDVICIAYTSIVSFSFIVFDNSKFPRLARIHNKYLTFYRENSDFQKSENPDFRNSKCIVIPDLRSCNSDFELSYARSFYKVFLTLNVLVLLYMQFTRIHMIPK